MSADEPLVLIVEDELQMRRFLRAALVANGYRVVEATTAAEAIALAPSHNPAFVLLDHWPVSAVIRVAAALNLTVALLTWLWLRRLQGAPSVPIQSAGCHSDRRAGQRTDNDSDSHENDDN